MSELKKGGAGSEPADGGVSAEAIDGAAARLPDRLEGRVLL